MSEWPGIDWPATSADGRPSGWRVARSGIPTAITPRGAISRPASSVQRPEEAQLVVVGSRPRWLRRMLVGFAGETVARWRTPVIVVRESLT